MSIQWLHQHNQDASLFDEMRRWLNTGTNVMSIAIFAVGGIGWYFQAISMNEVTAMFSFASSLLLVDNPALAKVMNFLLPVLLQMMKQKDQLHNQESGSTVEQEESSSSD